MKTILDGKLNLHKIWWLLNMVYGEYKILFYYLKIILKISKLIANFIFNKYYGVYGICWSKIWRHHEYQVRKNGSILWYILKLYVKWNNVIWALNIKLIHTVSPKITKKSKQKYKNKKCIDIIKTEWYK